jgi:hypothetical protein
MLVARASTGAYVRGRCDQRGNNDLELANRDGRVTARIVGTVEGVRSTITSTDHIFAIELASPQAADTRVAASLTIAIAGHPPTTLSGAELDSTTRMASRWPRSWTPPTSTYRRRHTSRSSPPSNAMRSTRPGFAIPRST